MNQHARLTIGFKELLKQQSMLQERMGWSTGKSIDGFRMNLLAMIAEGIEALNELPWKLWKRYEHGEYLSSDLDKKILATELTDILQFWANLALCVDITPEELTTALVTKWKTNHQRIDADRDGAE